MNTMSCMMQPSWVRRCALDLMRLTHEGTETDVAITAAMVGMAKEANKVNYLLRKCLKQHNMDLKYIVCEKIRMYTANLLSRLKEEFAGNTADENDISTSGRSEKLIGVSRDVNCEERGAIHSV